MIKFAEFKENGFVFNKDKNDSNIIINDVSYKKEFNATIQPITEFKHFSKENLNNNDSDKYIFIIIDDMIPRIIADADTIESDTELTCLIEHIHYLLSQENVFAVYLADFSGVVSEKRIISEAILKKYKDNIYVLLDFYAKDEDGKEITSGLNARHDLKSIYGLSDKNILNFTRTNKFQENEFTESFIYINKEPATARTNTYGAISIEEFFAKLNQKDHLKLMVQDLISAYSFITNGHPNDISDITNYQGWKYKGFIESVKTNNTDTNPLIESFKAIFWYPHTLNIMGGESTDKFLGLRKIEKQALEDFFKWLLPGVTITFDSNNFQQTNLPIMPGILFFMNLFKFVATWHKGSDANTCKLSNIYFCQTDKKVVMKLIFEPTNDSAKALSIFDSAVLTSSHTGTVKSAFQSLLACDKKILLGDNDDGVLYQLLQVEDLLKKQNNFEQLTTTSEKSLAFLVKQIKDLWPPKPFPAQLNRVYLRPLIHYEIDKNGIKLFWDRVM